MRKTLVAFMVFLFVVIGLLIACLVSEPIKIGVANGIIGIWTWIVTKFSDITHSLLTSPISPYLFWLVMPISGFIIGSILVARFHFSKVKQILAHQKATEVGYQQTPTTQPVVIPKSTASPTVNPTPVVPAPESETKTELEPET